MRADVKNLLIKFMAITVIFLFFYPVVLVMRTFIFQDAVIWTDFVFSIAIIFLGFILSNFIIKDMKSFIRPLITYCLAIIPVVASILIYKSEGVYRLLLEVPVVLLIYFTGVKAYFTDVDEILSNKTIGTGIVSLTGCLLISKIDQNYGHLITPVSAYAYISMILAFLVKNQQNLNRTFKKRHIDAASVPKNIRKYNIGIVIVMFFLILILFNMKNMVIFLFRIGGYVILGVLWLFSFLLSLFTGSEKGGGEGGGQPDFFGELGGESSLIAQIIYTIIFGTLILFVAILFFRSIARHFPEFIQKIKNIFLKFIKWITSLFAMASKSDEGSEDYTDHVETVVPKKEVAFKSSQHKKINSIKSGLRMLKKTDDPVKKIRFVYYLMLMVLSDKNIEIRKSDTTGEIYKKALHIEGMKGDFGDITKIYNEVRYNESVPDKAEVEDTVKKFGKIYDMLK